jgi:hypothetical protein
LILTKVPFGWLKIKNPTFFGNYFLDFGIFLLTGFTRVLRKHQGFGFSVDEVW